MTHRLAKDQLLESALAGLPSLTQATVDVLNRRRSEAVPVLVRLLQHPDPDWRRAAATAFARMRTTPPTAREGLLRLLAAPSTSGKIAALAAMDWLPKSSKAKVTNAVARLLLRKQRDPFPFTTLRSHTARSVAAHWLSSHGGRRGLVTLRLASRRSNDPVSHQIHSALQRAIRRVDYVGSANKSSVRAPLSG